MMSWLPSPVCAAGSMPLTACLSLQLVLQARMARNLKQTMKMFVNSYILFPAAEQYSLSIDLLNLGLWTRRVSTAAVVFRISALRDSLHWLVL